MKESISFSNNMHQKALLEDWLHRGHLSSTAIWRWTLKAFVGRSSRDETLCALAHPNAMHTLLESSLSSRFWEIPISSHIPLYIIMPCRATRRFQMNNIQRKLISHSVQVPVTLALTKKHTGMFSPSFGLNKMMLFEISDPCNPLVLPKSLIASLSQYTF